MIRDETGAVDCEAMREKVQRDIVMYGMLGARPSLEAAREHCGEELGLGGEAPDPEGP
ncbi:MAG: hypothetical protein GWO02_05105 [Gammaproteobacteria bacterium]|nr:hypothetical protein [Gammaproteobacteria bacterium]